MKTAFLLVIFAFLLASCNKSHCWECTRTQKSGEASTEIVCNSTRQQIEELEENAMIGNHIESYKCKKK